MSQRIIVAEDDESLRYAIERALTLAGFRLETYADAVNAWDPVADAGRLDLLVADIVFPAGRSNGVALARHARDHHPGVAVIYITGDPDAVRFVIDEPHQVLVKPFELQTLVEASRKAIIDACGEPPATLRQ